MSEQAKNIYLEDLTGEADLDLDTDLETERSKDLLPKKKRKHDYPDFVLYFSFLNEATNKEVKPGKRQGDQYLRFLFGLLLLLRLLLRLLEGLPSYFLTCNKQHKLA